MKKILFAIATLFFVAAGGPANAGTSYNIGGTTYFTNDDGTSGSAYSLGGTTYWNDNKGNSGSASNIGGTTYFNDNRGTNGSAYNIGGTTFYSDNKGTNGSLYNIGGTTYWNDNKGNNGSSYDIGGTTYYNDSKGMNSSLYNIGGKSYSNPWQVPSYTRLPINVGWSPVLEPIRLQVQPKTNGVDMDAINRLKNFTITPQPVYYPSYPALKPAPSPIPLSERVRLPSTQPKVCPDPANSYIAADDRCYCNKSGYTWNQAQTACVPPENSCSTTSLYHYATESCVSFDQVCKALYGQGSYSTGGLKTTTVPNCDCGVGYTWDDKRTSCFTRGDIAVRGTIMANRPNKIYIYDYSAGVKGKLLKTVQFDSTKVASITVPSNNLYITWDGAKKNAAIKSEVSLEKRGLDERYTDAEAGFIVRTGLQKNQSYNFYYQHYYYEGTKRLGGGAYNILVLKPTTWKKFTSLSPLKLKAAEAVVKTVDQPLAINPPLQPLPSSCKTERGEASYPTGRMTPGNLIVCGCLTGYHFHTSGWCVKDYDFGGLDQRVLCDALSLLRQSDAPPLHVSQPQCPPDSSFGRPMIKNTVENIAY